MALVTQAERDIVEQFITLTVSVKTQCEEMLVLLNKVRAHIASENTAPGAGNNAEWTEIVDWYLPQYQSERDDIVEALTNLPDV